MEGYSRHRDCRIYGFGFGHLDGGICGLGFGLCFAV